MASRDLNATFHIQIEDGKVEQRSGNDSHIDHVASRFRNPLQEPITEGGRAQAAIAAEGYSLYLIVGKVGPATLSQEVDEILGQVSIDDSPDVIFPKYVWIEVHFSNPVQQALPLDGFRDHPDLLGSI